MEDKVMQSYINTYINERIWTEYPVSTINNLNSFLSFTGRIEKKWIRMHLICFWFLSFNSRQYILPLTCALNVNYVQKQTKVIN